MQRAIIAVRGKTEEKALPLSGHGHSKHRDRSTLREPCGLGGGVCSETRLLWAGSTPTHPTGVWLVGVDFPTREGSALYLSLLAF